MADVFNGASGFDGLQNGDEVNRALRMAIASGDIISMPEDL